MIRSRFISLITTIILFSLFNSAYSQNLNKDELYKNSFRPDLPRSMQDIPYEDDDYNKTHYSPYALVRIQRTAKSGNDIISPGYYLVKPFSENSVDYLLFKLRNQTIALVPIVKKTDLEKKVKKMKLELIEDDHGKKLILNIKYKLKSYTGILNIID